MSEEDERVSPPSNGDKEETQSFIPATAPPISTTTTTIATTPTSSCKDGNSATHPLSECSTVAVPMLSIPPQQEPPDGGLQAWLVMLASFFCNGILFGTINSSGVIFAELRNDLEAQGAENPASKASLCLSLTIGMTFLMSLVSGVLTDKLGVRTTTFIGGALATGGLFISSLVYHRIEYLTLSFGFLLGLGGSLAYTPSLVILGHYFRKRMGIVNGFVTAGSSLFTILMPMMFEVVLERYNLKVLFQILTAFMAMLMVCAFIFKPRLAVLPRDRQYAADDQAHRPMNFRSKCKQILGQIINFEIWRNKRFVIWALCIPVALFGYFVPYVHLVAYTKKVLGEQVEAQVLVQCIGATSGIGRVLFGYVADKPWVNRIVLQQVSFFCIGTFTMLLTAWHNFYFFVVLALGMGLFDGCFISLLGPVAFDIVGPAGAPQAIGSLLALCSVPLTFGPVFAGWLVDSTGSYFLPFLMAGIPPIAGSVALFSMRCVKQPLAAVQGSPVREAGEPQNNSASLVRQHSFSAPTENGYPLGATSAVESTREDSAV